jgi:hypothetical protein
LLSRAHNLDAATKREVESVTPQRSHSKDTRHCLLPTSGELPILGVRFPYVGHLELSLSPSHQRQGASSCQVDYCEFEDLHSDHSAGFYRLIRYRPSRLVSFLVINMFGFFGCRINIADFLMAALYANAFGIGS